jgi:hypothetical protein
MLKDRTRVLLIVSRDVLDEARVFAGKATTALKLPVSLQIILRALIEEGLKRSEDRELLANVAHQARAVREIRSLSRRHARSTQFRESRKPAGPPSRSARRTRRH